MGVHLVFSSHLEKHQYYVLLHLATASSSIARTGRAWLWGNINKDKNRTAASVNLTGSPFYFSSRFNVFGCVGCGNLASIFRNQTDPIGGCLEPRCGDETSKDLTFPQDINIDTTHVSAILEWNLVKCDMEERCGNVDIQSNLQQNTFISRINLQLLSVSFSEESISVNNSVTYFNCRSIENNGISVNLTGSSFFFSNIDNGFVSVGCGSLATIYHNRSAVYPLGGCLQPGCSNMETFNSGCLMTIPPGLSSFVANVTEIYPNNDSNRSCGSSFMIGLSLLDSDVTIFRDALVESSTSHVPRILQWGTPKVGLHELKEGSKIFCSPGGE
ncbi:hypothetical protein POUND7_019609 [Theobroma cacao]